MNTPPVIDWVALRDQFPSLAQPVRNGKSLIYLDAAAAAQKPWAVIDAERGFYERTNAAVHRGAHYLAEQATVAFESARADVAAFIGADVAEVVWTSSATAALNTVAYAFGNASLGRGGASSAPFALRPGDEIVVTEAEHHANLIPWQELCARTGAVLRWLGLTDAGRLDLSNLDQIITERTRILAFGHVSNVTGALAPVADLVAAARRVGAFTVLDACQSVPHLPVDFRALGVDFAAFGGHKLYGPTGIGVLYGRKELLAAMPPVFTGGSMVEVVTMDSATYVPPPQRFEAGTQPTAQAIALGAAARWLGEIGMANIATHGRAMTAELLKIAEIPGVRIIGPGPGDSNVQGGGTAAGLDRVPVVTFAVDGVHAHDVGQVLDDAGIAVRVGHHCAQPLHRRFGVAATARASASITTTPKEIATFHEALTQVRPFFGL
ncbi:MAG: SufS family cysteine desulfurase [Promicromonosporaceae bacterium]|nr:SufS family cysteine desulfurase [Promicromonosporaceae bacterium]